MYLILLINFVIKLALPIEIVTTFKQYVINLLWYIQFGCYSFKIYSIYTSTNILYTAE